MRVASAVVVVLMCLPLAGLLVLAGCDREDEIRSYRAPKDMPAPTPPRPVTAPHPVMNAERPRFDVPADWKDVSGGEQSMRFAAYQVSEADPSALFTVIPLGREGSEVLPNVVRWAGQVDLPPTREEDLPKFTRQIDVNGVDVTLVDLSGPKLRTLGAIVPRGQRVWFFKLTGATDIIAGQEQKFDAVVRSIRFESEGGMHATAQTAPAPPGPPANAGTATPPEGAGSPPQWQVPQGWVKDADRPMRFATFRTSDQPDAAEVIVSSFGAFGTMLDNINRWRGMVGLEPVKDVADQPVERITVGGREAALFDMTGPETDGRPGLRLTLAMVPVEQTVWFFRLTGPSDVVEQQRAKFDEFLASVRFVQ